MYLSGVQATYKALMLPGLKTLSALNTVNTKIFNLVFYPFNSNQTKKAQGSQIILPIPTTKRLPVQGTSNKIQTNKKTTATSPVVPKVTVLNISTKGASKKPAVLLNQKFLSLPTPTQASTLGLPGKAFIVAKPYKYENNQLDWTQIGYLTHVELFQMLTNPLMGNFCPGIAAIFVAIAAYETGNIDIDNEEYFKPVASGGGGKIPIGIANGSEHLGFFQLRCKPEKGANYNTYIDPLMQWNAPYDAKNGQVVLFSQKGIGGNGLALSKRYAWESFLGIRNSTYGGAHTTAVNVEKILKDIYNPVTRKSAIDSIILRQPRSPAETGETYNSKKHSAREYGGADSTEASSHLADWARIAANQIWMMKSKFQIGPKHSTDLPENIKRNISAIVAPFKEQLILINDPNEMPNKKTSIFEPWNDHTLQYASTNVAYNVLNKALNYDYDEAKSELKKLLSYEKKFESAIDFNMLKTFINSSVSKTKIYRLNIIN